MTQQPFPPSGPTTQPRPQQPVRQLRRSTTDRKIGGVCGGIGAYFGVDATLVRVALVILTIMTGGAFILAYLVAFLVMPEQTAGIPQQTAGMPGQTTVPPIWPGDTMPPSRSS